MKKLVSMLLVLCLVLCSVTMVALADDSDMVTYEITDENITLLEKFKADPSSVSFDELSQAMNEDIVFAAEAYKVLCSVCVPLYEDVSDIDDVSENYLCDTYAMDVVPVTMSLHDFVTGVTESCSPSHGIEPQYWDPEGFYPPRINRYNWKEGVCRIFVRVGSFYGWASGFRVGPHWIMTCAHSFYTLIDKDLGNGEVWSNHTFADSVLAVPGYIGGLPDTEMDPDTHEITLTMTNSPYGVSAVDITQSYICEQYIQLSSSDAHNISPKAMYDWAFLHIDETYNPTSYFELCSLEEFFDKDYAGKKYYMAGYPGTFDGENMVDRDIVRNECEYRGHMDLKPRIGYFTRASIGGMSGGPLLDMNYFVLGMCLMKTDAKFENEFGEMEPRGICGMFSQASIDIFNQYQVLGT